MQGKISKPSTFPDIIKSKFNHWNIIDEEQLNIVVKPKIKLAKHEETSIDEEQAKQEEKPTKTKVSLFSHKRTKVEESEANLEGEDQINEYTTKRKLKNFGKNPDVNTSFLKDEDREFEDEIKKKKLMNEFILTHMERRKELLRVKYWYWDGSGKKSIIIIKKGDSVWDFIRKALKRLSK